MHRNFSSFEKVRNCLQNKFFSNKFLLPINYNENYSHRTPATASASTIALEFPHLSFRKVINWAMSRS